MNRYYPLVFSCGFIAGRLFEHIPQSVQMSWGFVIGSAGLLVIIAAAIAWAAWKNR